MLQAKIYGELTGQDDGSPTIDPQQSRVNQASPGRSSMPLPWPLTHGVLCGSIKIVTTDM